MIPPARCVRDATVAVFPAIALLPRVVEGLTAADFTILEDGQPQTIDTFEFVRHAADRAHERVPPVASRTRRTGRT